MNSYNSKSPKMLYCNGRSVIVRDVANPSLSLIFTEHKAQVNVAQFSPNGNFIASGDSEGKLIIWGFPNMKVKNEFQVLKTINDLDWDADG
jgi:WD40 repeat protein